MRKKSFRSEIVFQELSPRGLSNASSTMRFGIVPVSILRRPPLSLRERVFEVIAAAAMVVVLVIVGFLQHG